MNQISEILQNARTIAVVGLSGKRFRPSYGVAEYMQRAGYRIIPVNPNEMEVLGEKCYARLEDIPKTEEIEIVDIFRRSEFIPPVVDSAITVGARVIWMQQGIENHTATAKARAVFPRVVFERFVGCYRAQTLFAARTQLPVRNA